MKEQKNLTIPLLCGISGNIIWGFSYLFTRMAQQCTTPLVQISLRFLLAFLLMTVLWLTGLQKVNLRGKKLRLLILLAVLEPVYFFCESYGIYYSNSTFAGVSLAIVPVLAMALAFFTLRERPSRGQVLFSFLPIIGVVILTLANSAMGVIQPMGVILVFGACICSAIGRVLNRSAAAEFTSFERTYVIIASSCLVFNIVALISVRGDFTPYVQALSSPSFLLSTVVLSVFCSVVANLLVHYAVGVLSVTVSSSLGNIITVCAMFAGVVFLHEPMDLWSFAGSILVIAGIWLVAREERRAESRKLNVKS